MSDKFKLEGHIPVPVDDLIEWGRWIEKANRHVAQDRVGDVQISTVFLGLDHSFGQPGPPILFETMVFGGPLDSEMERYATWEEAEIGHKAMLERVRAA